MRRCDIVFAILLILSIIDFALAAPVLVQEKRQAHVDVAKDVRTVLRKRAGEDLAKLAEEYVKTWGKPFESSDTHASSSSASPGPDHESTDVEQVSAPNPASSTANPDSLVEPQTQSWAALMSTDPFEHPWDDVSSTIGSVHSLDLAPGSPLLDEGRTSPKSPISNPVPSENGDADFDWDYWQNVESPPRLNQAPPKGIGPAPGYQYLTELDFGRNSMAALHLSPSLSPLKFNKDLNVNPSSPEFPSQPTKIYSSYPGSPASNSPPPTPAKIHSHSYPGSPLAFASSPTRFFNVLSPGAESPKELEHVVDHPQTPELASLKGSEFGVVHPAPSDAGSLTGSSDADFGPPASPLTPDLQHHSDLYPPVSPSDVLNAIYEVKGKAKESRRVSGIARDVRDAAQRELQQPAEKVA